MGRLTHGSTGLAGKAPERKGLQRPLTFPGSRDPGASGAYGRGGHFFLLTYSPHRLGRMSMGVPGARARRLVPALPGFARSAACAVIRTRLCRVAARVAAGDRLRRQADYAQAMGGAPSLLELPTERPAPAHGLCRRVLPDLARRRADGGSQAACAAGTAPPCSRRCWRLAVVLGRRSGQDTWHRHSHGHRGRR